MDIRWLGDSLEIAQSYSAPVRQAIGSELRLLQKGERPIHCRPLKTIGRGVWEIKVAQKAGQFRVVYLVRRGDKIYVLHVFQKKSQRTPKRDLDLARNRLKEI